MEHLKRYSDRDGDYIDLSDLYNKVNEIVDWINIHESKFDVHKPIGGRDCIDSLLQSWGYDLDKGIER